MKQFLLVLLVLPVFSWAQVQLAHRSANSDQLTASATHEIISDNSEDWTCEFYPNKTTGYVHTYCSSNILSFKLADAQGKILFNKINQPAMLIKLNELPSGLYLLYVEDIEHKVRLKKINIAY